MEWPTIDIENVLKQHPEGSNHQMTETDEEYLVDLTSAMITKEIYSRAANASITDITIDHQASGRKEKVEGFLKTLRNVDLDDWQVTAYRRIALEFTELMASAGSGGRVLDICNGGLDAVHNLFHYHVPAESCTDTSMIAKDAFVLCSSFQKLETNTFTGTRAPDLDFSFGLLTKPPDRNLDADDANAVFGIEACHKVNELYDGGQMETSAASLAKHTLTNSSLVSQLAHKTFVVLGCDHPLSPTKSLLKIPGVTLLGIPSSWNGMQDVLEYAQYNCSDDTTLIYPKWQKDNLVLTRGPQVAQWILDNTTSVHDHPEVDHHHHHTSELVLISMPEPPSNIPKKPESVVRWAVSSDLILQRVLQARNKKRKCSLWSYQSSTTCMVVPPSSTTKSRELLQDRPSHEPWLHSLSLGTILQPSEEEASGNHDYSIVNGILSSDGPHHVLSEHIRLWRALVTGFHQDEPHDYYPDSDDDDDDDDDEESFPEVHVFAPYMPLLDTEPVVVLDPSLLQPWNAGTASSLLTAIGLAGLCDPILHRPMPVIEYGSGGIRDDIETTPFAMFWNGSVHGGIWNCPYSLDSLGGTLGYVLSKVYEYYKVYTQGGEEDETSTDASLKKESVSDDQPTIVDTVPSKEIADFIQERLEILA